LANTADLDSDLLGKFVWLNLTFISIVVSYLASYSELTPKQVNSRINDLFYLKNIYFIKFSLSFHYLLRKMHSAGAASTEICSQFAKNRGAEAVYEGPRPGGKIPGALALGKRSDQMDSVLVEAERAL
jgi:hypothetical protein